MTGTLSPTEPDGDYVVVPRRKLKLSRARKAVIGMMVLGTVAAIGGGGSFASFTANTTNANNVFQTGLLQLKNDGPGNACFSTDQQSTGAGNVGDNDNAACDALFTATTLNIPGAAVNADLVLENTGNIPGYIQVYTANGATCTSAASDAARPTGAGELCSVVTMTIQEFNDLDNDGVYDGAGEDLTGGDTYCVFPYSAGSNCAAGGTLASFYAASGLDGSGVGGLPAIAATKQIAAAAKRAYRISLSFPSTGVTAGGVGSENAYQNRKLNSFNMSWRLVDEQNLT